MEAIGIRELKARASELVRAVQERRFPGSTLIALDDTLAQDAAELAARHRLRSSNAVYVALVRRFGATLITLDAEQGERGGAVVPVQRI